MARSIASREHHSTVPMTFSHPRDTQRSLDLVWDAPVRFKCSELFDSFDEWCGHKRQEGEAFHNVAAQKFYEILKVDLNLPLKETRPGNVRTWGFVPCEMNAVVKRAIGQHTGPPAIDEDKHEALMRQFQV